MARQDGVRRYRQPAAELGGLLIMALGLLVPLKLELVFDLRVSFGEELPLGPTSLAHDRVFHLVTGGTVSGPRLVGILVPNSGSDAPCRSKDRAVIEGEWLIRAAD